MSYPVTEITGIDDDAAKALKSAGIRTTASLLEAAKDPKGRKALAAKTGLREGQLLNWANVADRMRIKGVGGDYADLLNTRRRQDRARSEASQWHKAVRGHKGREREP